MREGKLGRRFHWVAYVYLSIFVLAAAELAVHAVASILTGQSTFSSLSFSVQAAGFAALPIGLGILKRQRFWKCSAMAYSLVLLAASAALAYAALDRQAALGLRFVLLAPPFLPWWTLPPLGAALCLASLAQLVVLVFGGPMAGTRTDVQARPPAHWKSRAVNVTGTLCAVVAAWSVIVPAVLLPLSTASPPAVTYAGAITDEAGQPIAGAAVVLRTTNRPLREAATGRDGKFVFEEVPSCSLRRLAVIEEYRGPGVHTLEASAPGHVTVLMPLLPLSETMQRRVRLFRRLAAAWPIPWKTPDSTLPAPPAVDGAVVSGLQITLPRSASVAGRVVNASGIPVPDYRAHLLPAPEPPETAFQQSYAVQPLLLSDASGSFQVSNIPPGAYWFGHWSETASRFEHSDNPPLELGPGQVVAGYRLLAPTS